MLVDPERAQLRIKCRCRYPKPSAVWSINFATRLAQHGFHLSFSIHFEAGVIALIGNEVRLLLHDSGVPLPLAVTCFSSPRHGRCFEVSEQKSMPLCSVDI